MGWKMQTKKSFLSAKMNVAANIFRSLLRKKITTKNQYNNKKREINPPGKNAKKTSSITQHIIIERKNVENMLLEIFSPKQTELFLKKSQGLPFNKTEKEYFSRVIKKKVVTLADTDIHRLAQKILTKT